MPQSCAQDKERYGANEHVETCHYQPSPLAHQLLPQYCIDRPADRGKHRNEISYEMFSLNQLKAGYAAVYHQYTAEQADYNAESFPKCETLSDENGEGGD